MHVWINNYTSNLKYFLQLAVHLYFVSTSDLEIRMEFHISHDLESCDQRRRQRRAHIMMFVEVYVRNEIIDSLLLRQQHVLINSYTEFEIT